MRKGHQKMWWPVVPCTSRKSLRTESREDIEEILKTKLATIKEEPEMCEENLKLTKQYRCMAKKGMKKLRSKATMGRFFTPQYSLRDSYIRDFHIAKREEDIGYYAGYVVETDLQAGAQYKNGTHPDLNKSERRHLCQILDCKKFSVEACMHAAQNELLPLRVVVQVLFFGQARVAMAGGEVTELPNNIKALLATHDDPSKPSTHTTVPAEDQWSVSCLKSPKSKLSTLRMKLAEDNDLDENFKDGIGKSSKVKAICAFPTRLKGMFSNLWSINRSASEKN
ncbi:hypothetical protein F0562_020119 [Nyssa sinensis]|uniref:NPH3 domain-containing protein n=1 Tax=Nyssa sinensis TaxID=561372 RepID=A0A5J5BQR8_9ASTE|nr:hypothetical protein F0562_020119 [Nyssa sinensis]